MIFKCAFRYLKKTVKNRVIHSIGELFSKNPELPNVLNLLITENKNALLILTALLGEVNTVDFILSNYGADVNAQDSIGWTALQFACCCNHEEVVRLLLKKGADTNAQDLIGSTPLHKACLRNNEKIIGLLVEYGAEISVQDIYGVTPIALLNASHETYDRRIITIVKELAKLTYENLQVSESAMNLIFRTNLRAREIFEKCMIELNQMANTKFHGTHTYYSVLKLKMCMKKLAQLMNNGKLVLKYKKDLLHKFSYYESDLRKIFHEAIRIRDRNAIIDTRLHSIFGDAFPDEVICNFREYLTVDDLPQ